MREHNPSWQTMGALLYEDENPQVTAKFVVAFDDEDELVEVPVGIGQPEFLTTVSLLDSDVRKLVRWFTETYRPDRPCRVVALRVDFIDYNDFAIRALGDGEGQRLDWYDTEEGDRVLDAISSSYHISGNSSDSERQLC